MDTRVREKSRETRALLRDSRFVTTCGRTIPYGGTRRIQLAVEVLLGKYCGLEECSAQHSLVSSLERLHSLPKRVTGNENGNTHSFGPFYEGHLRSLDRMTMACVKLKPLQPHLFQAAKELLQ